jgi:hypothetical protein
MSFDDGFDLYTPPPNPPGPRYVIIYTKDLTRFHYNMFEQIASIYIFPDDLTGKQIDKITEFFLFMDGRKQNHLDYMSTLIWDQFYFIHYSDSTYPLILLPISNRVYDIPVHIKTFEEIKSVLCTPYVHIQEMRRLYELEQDGKVFEPFQTQMDVASNRRIISLSDIHGDIDSLLICLRDCADVIVKKERYRFDSNIERDPNLEILLVKDINDQDYVRDLNYQWNEANSDTIVVIIGDLIDPLRSDTAIDPLTGIPSLYYSQVELKLLHFINALNENALETMRKS